MKEYAKFQISIQITDKEYEDGSPETDEKIEELEDKLIDWLEEQCPEWNIDVEAT